MRISPGSGVCAWPWPIAKSSKTVSASIGYSPQVRRPSERIFPDNSAIRIRVLGFTGRKISEKLTSAADRQENGLFRRQESCGVSGCAHENCARVKDDNHEDDYAPVPAGWRLLS